MISKRFSIGIILLIALNSLAQNALANKAQEIFKANESTSNVFATDDSKAKSNSLANYEPGFYIGAQGGYGKTSEGDGPQKKAVSYSPSAEIDNKSAIRGRLFMGYSFTPNWSFEWGFTLYPSNTYKADITVLGVTLANYYKFKTDFAGIDFMAKGILPLEQLSTKLTGFNLYAKLGLVMTFTYYERNHYFLSEAEKILVFGTRPGYGIGLGYNFTDHFGVDLSWSGVISFDKLNSNHMAVRDYKHIPSAYLIGLGLTYKF
jgi:hypothetical protein